MAVRLVRQRDAEQPRHLGRPRAGRVHDLVRANRHLALGRPHPRGPAAANADAVDARAARLEADDLVPGRDLDAELLRRLRVAPDERPGEDHAVVRVVAGRLETRDVELRHEAPRLFGGEHACGQAAVVLERDARLESLSKGRRARQKEVPALAKPDVDLHLRGELAAHADAVEHQAHVGLARPLRANAAAVASAGASAEVTLVDDRDLRHAHLGQVVGDREAHDPGPDDDDVGVIAHGGSPAKIPPRTRNRLIERRSARGPVSAAGKGVYVPSVLSCGGNSKVR